MDTLAQQTVKTPDPLPEWGTIPYFRAVADLAIAARGVKPQPWAPLATRIALVRAAIEEAETWYAGGLTPEPWAA